MGNKFKNASIFISYTRKDHVLVEKLYHDLCKAGHKPWLDTRDIVAGENWRRAIKNAIKKADFFIACLTNNSVNKRGVVREEIKIALEVLREKLPSDIFVIPVRFDDCEIPEDLQELQCVDMFHERSWEQLEKAIQVGLERLTDTAMSFGAPSNHELSDSELNLWIQRNAEYFAAARTAETTKVSTQEEMTRDWQSAVVLLANDILHGRIDFAARLTPDCYNILENIWLKDVKQIMAYLLWTKRQKAGEANPEGVSDYYSVSHDIQSLLIDASMKAMPAEFKKVKCYLEDQYLRNGMLDINKPTVRMILARKAQRIWETTSVMSAERNWKNAEVYTKMFYENIISAVVDNDHKSILMILKAFHFSKAPENRFLITNCFEVALVVYFVNPEIIQHIWSTSEEEIHRETTL